MKKNVYFSNSRAGARKTNQAYKNAQRCSSEDPPAVKATARDEAAERQGGIYNQWLWLFGGLCLCFLLLITSGDRIRSFSHSDGVVMISEYIKEKIDEDESIAVFFGFQPNEDENESAGTPTPEYSEDEIPVFSYGEGLGAEEYIEKYNGINYEKSGVIPVIGTVSSEYSFRKNPFWKVYKDESEYEFHSGIDIAADEGKDILCYLDGVVEKAALSASYGYYVCVDHGNGMKTLYAHASELLCDVGDEVSKGEVIAKVGSTGRATGPHLHFEVIKDGRTVNPKEYLGVLYA